MPNNELYFDRNEKALAFYKQLPAQQRATLDTALDFLRANPEPDGVLTTSILLAPVVIFYYRDDAWKVSYSLSFIPKDNIFKINVLAIAPA